MATPTQPHRSSLTHRLIRLIIVACAFCLAATIAPATALAEPPALPDSPDAVAQQVTELQHELEVISEQRNDAQVSLDQYVADAAAATVALGQVNVRLAQLDGKVRAVARSAFAGDRLGSFSAILTSDSPQEFLDRVNTLEFISGQDGLLLAEASRAHDDAQALQDTADAAVVSAQSSVADIATRTDELETQLATYRVLYSQLTAGQQNIIGGGGGGGGQSPPGEIIAPSEAARIAVETAYAQLGKPYVYGADGPDAFDCSGLTMYSYAAAGVSLPHSSRQQSTMGMAVSFSDLQPGDLVFYYNPVSHVSIYVGDGMVISASNSSRPVELIPVDAWGAYNSSRRIAG